MEVSSPLLLQYWATRKSRRVVIDFVPIAVGLLKSLIQSMIGARQVM